MLNYKWNEELGKRKAQAEATFGELQEIFKVAKSNNLSLDFIEIVQTPHRIQQRFLELLLATKSRLASFNRSPYSFMAESRVTKKLNEQIDANKIMAERNISLRTIVMYEKNLWPILGDKLQESSDSKTEDMRIIDFLPIKLHVFDNKSVLFALHSITEQHKGNLTQIIIHDESFARVCMDLFELYWDRAIPLSEWQKKM